MLLAKTKIGPSKIHGAGLFADEHILAGTPIWKFKDGLDESYTKEEAERLPEPKRSQILNLLHSYISKQTGKYILSGDDMRYMNHSTHPNTELLFDRAVEGIQAATRDIERGEEMTIDYRSFAAEGINFELGPLS